MTKYFFTLGIETHLTYGIYVINFFDTIDKQSFVFISNPISKKSTYECIVRKASYLYNFDSLKVLNNLFKRERLGSTVVGNGIAIPHVVDEIITEPKGIISILSKGVNFDSLDNIPVDIIFLLFFPSNKKTEYLQILASISRLLRNTDLTNKLRGCKSQESAFATFSQIIEYKAA